MPMPDNPPLHHVGIVQPDEAAAQQQMALMGLAEDYRGYVPQFEALCIFTRAPHGGSPIEFVVPAGGSLARFNKGAGGVHHVAFAVPDIAALTADFAARGIAMVEAVAVRGAGDFLCNFVRPSATRGVLIEYVELLR